MDNMDIWVDIAQPKIIEEAKTDAGFLEASELYNRKEQEYLKAVEGLSDEQKEAIENYIAACENLEFQYTRIAYFMRPLVIL